MAQQPPNFNTILKDIFPGISDQEVNGVIALVEEGNPNDSFEGKIENMVNLISGDGAWGPLPDGFVESGGIRLVNQMPAQSINDELLNTLYGNLVTIFPDASPDFLWQFCKERQDVFDLNEAVEELSLIKPVWGVFRPSLHLFKIRYDFIKLNLKETNCLVLDGYDKIELDPLTIWEQLKDALPGADPLYLKKEATRLALLSPQDMD
ncbi:hypothetical protein NQ314_007978, partial [Rhamnusium bicolor]